MKISISTNKLAMARFEAIEAITVLANLGKFLKNSLHPDFILECEIVYMETFASCQIIMTDVLSLLALFSIIPSLTKAVAKSQSV